MGFTIHEGCMPTLLSLPRAFFDTDSHASDVDERLWLARVMILAGLPVLQARRLQGPAGHHRFRRSLWSGIRRNVLRYRVAFKFLFIATAVFPFSLQVVSQNAAEGAPVASQPPAAAKMPPPKVELPPITREDAYRMFIGEVGSSEQYIEQSIQLGKTPLPERRHFGQCLGLHADADQSIYAIVLSAFRDIQAANQVVSDAVVPHRQLSKEEADNLAPVMEARDRKEAAILKEMVALLQQQLGEADFKKLEAYIFALEDEGKPWSVVDSGNRTPDMCESTGSRPYHRNPPK